MQHTTRRTFIAAALATGALPLATRAQPAGWKPVKPVVMVVPYPPGGLFDSIARQVGLKLSAALGQPVVIDNRPGANTMIGAAAVARAQPDGHTVLFTTDASLSVVPFLYSKIAYDPERDFAPVTLLGLPQQCLIANATLAANTLPELVALAKKEPKAIAYGSYGMGSNAHLETEGIKLTYGLEMTHVPYKGQAELYQALLNNDIQFVAGTPGIGLQHIRAGKLKVLAVLDAQRSPLFPGVLTAREQGMPVQGGAWFGFAVPAQTPVAAIAALNREISTIAADPAFRETHLAQNGLVPAETGPAAMARRLVADKARYQALTSRLAIKLD
jgi:tripartite-type tricarboxylate transporter receptor subunit TctC